MPVSFDRLLAKLAVSAVVLCMSAAVAAEAYAHTVRWPQSSCRTSLSSHCKKPLKTAGITLRG